MLDDPSQDPRPPEPNKKLVVKESDERRRKPFFLWRFAKFLFKLILGIFVFLIVLGGAAYLLVQTQWFHRFFQEQLLGYVNSQIGGTLEFDDYKLDLFRGIELYNVRLLAAGDTVISAPRANIRYNLEPLLVNSVVINRAEFYSARIKILRSSQDSTWNTDHIGKPTPYDTAAPPDWAVHLRDVRLYNSTLIIHDSTSRRSEHGIFDPVHMHARNLNLAGATDISIRDNRYRISVVSAEFYDQPSQTRVNKLATRVNMDTTRLEVLALHLKLPGSEVHGSIRWDKFNVFAEDVSERIFTAPVTAKVNFPSLEASELYKFVYFEPRFVGNFAGSATLSGSLTNMAIDDITLGVSNTLLRGRVLLTDIGHDEKFRYQIRVRDSKVQYADVRRHMPDLDLSAINNFGQMNIERLDMLGSEEKLVSDIRANGRFGKVAGNYTFDFTGALLGYTADLDVQNFNLAVIVPNDDLESRINGNIVIDGKGTSLDDLTADIRVDATNSMFLGRNVASAFIEARTEDKGLFTVDTARFTLPRSAANVRYSGADAVAVSPTLMMSGTLDMRNSGSPSYAMNVTASNVNPSQLFDVDGPDAIISGTFIIAGRGFDPDQMEGSVKASFSEFVLEDRALFPFELAADLQRVGPDRKIFNLTSPFADLHIEGQFGFGSLFTALSVQTQYFADLVEKKFGVVNKAVRDTDIQSLARSTTVTRPYRIRQHAPLDATFSAVIRDLSPLRPFLDSVEIQATGNLSGAIRGTPARYEMVLDTSTIDRFTLEMPGTLVRMSPFLIGGSISTANLNTQPELESLRLLFLSDSVIRVNDNIIQDPSLRLSYANDTADSYFSVGLNQTSEISLHGFLFPQEDRFNVVIDSLRVGYKDELGWTAAEPIRATLSGHGLDIQSLKLHRSNAELISVEGMIRNESLDGVTVRVHNFSLEDLQLFVPENQRERLNTLGGRIDSAAVEISGTFRNPLMDIEAQIQGFTYNNRLIGNGTVSLVHRNGVLTGTVGISNPELAARVGDTSAGNLQIQISSFPLDLGLASVPERLHRNAPVDISLATKRINLASIAPFIPSVNRFRGYADADISVRGPDLDNLNYQGSISFRDAFFVLAATNVGYFANGKISLEQNNVNVENIEIRNVANDNPNGRARIRGNITLRKFEISDIDLTMESPELLVMSRASAATSPNVYGRLIIATGAQPLHFFGSILEPNLQGDLNILDAYLFLPERQAAQRVRPAFRYEFDTAEVKMPLIPPDIAQDDTAALDTGSLVQSTDLPNPEETVSEVTDPPTDLVDRINYSMSIRLLGRVIINMELGTFDQLIAELEPLDRLTPMRFETGSDGRPKLFGELRVVEGSTFRFYRTFEASGKIEFITGDIANPRLDLTATYTGQRFFTDQNEPYTISLRITGTKEVPRLAFTYTIAGQEARGDRDRIQGDAISLLAFGRTQAELGQTSAIGGIGGAGIQAFTSVYLSKTLTDLVGGSGVIQDIGIEQGAVGSSGLLDMSQTQLRVSGQFKGVIWRYGGVLGGAESQNTVTLIFPLHLFFDDDWARNMSIQAQFSTVPEAAVNPFRNQKLWELRLNTRWAF